MGIQQSWIKIAQVFIFLSAILCHGVQSQAASTQSTYPMGEIGGRVAVVKGQPALEIKEVYPGQPGAAANLKPGMRIVGVAGQPFTTGYMMPLRQLGFAIDGARRQDGGLDLVILEGQKPQTITVYLSTAPGFSNTFPFKCARSEHIYDHVCQAMAEQFKSRGSLPGGEVTNALGVMALLGHKSGVGQKVVEPYIMNAAKAHASEPVQGGSVWKLSYKGVMLCEYYLINPDPVVAQAILNIAKGLAAGIPSHGRYGHGINLSNTDQVAYGGRGLNATTTAALWFFASASRCGLDPADVQPAFGMALDRVRKETGGGGGIGYAWAGDHQSSMRSGHAALAWHHLVVSPKMLGTITPNELSYRAKVATWPTRHSSALLEAHAVSSLGIAASTAGLAAFDRQQYVQLMSLWRWYFALAWQPNPSQPGQFEVSYVGGPGNTGGDYYLNGFRGLESGFSSIMNATVGFILASSHERLSFYGGMPPIPGLTTVLLAQSPPLAKSFMAMRQHKYSLAMRIALPLAKKLTEDGETYPAANNEIVYDPDQQADADEEKDENEVAEVALAMIDYVDARILETQFDYLDSLYEGDDVALAYHELRRFSTFVKGIRKYETDVNRMIQELSKDQYADRIKIGKKFYGLKKATGKGGTIKSNLRKWQKFVETCSDDYYRGQAQDIIDELRRVIEFNEQWGDKKNNGAAQPQPQPPGKLEGISKPVSDQF